MTVIVTDFDGTLVPIRVDPANVKPSKELIKTLNELHERNVRIIVLSGRNLTFLQGQLPSFVEIIAHRGNSNFIINQLKLTDLLEKLKMTITNALVNFEVKKIGVTVHYRLLRFRSAQQLERNLKQFCKKHRYNFIQGRKAIEITPLKVEDKVNVIKKMTKLNEVIFFGDDDSDAYAAQEVINNGGIAYLVKTKERKFTPKYAKQLTGVIQVRKTMQDIVKRLKPFNI